MKSKTLKLNAGWIYDVGSHSVIEASRRPGYSDYICVLPETINEARHAALISSAPELLAALKNALMEIEDGMDEGYASVKAVKDMARAAIAKAEGR